MSLGMADENHGKGGTYAIDDKGKRTLVEGSRTEPQPTQAELEAATAPPSTTLPKASEPAPQLTPKP